MFGINSGESIPQEILNSYEGWDTYMGHLWYHLLYFCNLKKSDIIIEVAPGSSNKIAQALAKINFSGTLYVVEPHAKIVNVINDSYKKWLPQANIIILNELLEHSLNKLPCNADFIISNHPLDDMLLSANLTSAELNELFDWAADMPSATFDSTINVWNRLNNNSEQLIANREHVLKTWHAGITDLKPKTVILSQYPSFMMESKGLNQLNRWGWHLLQQLREAYQKQIISEQLVQTILNSLKNYNDPHFGLEILNAQYWLLIKTNWTNSV